jgi:hypothetical protein
MKQEEGQEEAGEKEQAAGYQGQEEGIIVTKDEILHAGAGGGEGEGEGESEQSETEDCLAVLAFIAEQLQGVVDGEDVVVWTDSEDDS